MKKFFLLAVLFAVCAMQAQKLKFMPVSLRPDGSTPVTIHFYCSQDYDKAECIKDSLTLRQALAPYPTHLLEEWSYYLVMAQDWKALVVSQGGDPVSPAFTLLLGRATVLDRRLFSPSADRSAELMKWSGLPIGQPLIDLAVTHEMGHALCQEKNERKANDYGKQLREGKIPNCGKMAASKANGAASSVATTYQNQPPK